MIPETRYARSGRVELGYKILGDGPRDLVMCSAGPSHLDVLWELPELAAMAHGLARLGRLITYDKRGSGLSDRTTRRTPIEQRADDAIAVMDAASSREAVLIGIVDSAATFLVTAARHPDRVAAVVASEVVATSRADADHPWGWNPVSIAALLAIVRIGGWGRGLSLKRVAPELAEDERLHAWQKRLESMSATPKQAARLFRETFDNDIRGWLSSVQAPVLLTHDIANPLADVEARRWLEARLPNARLRLLEGAAGGFIPGDEFIDEVEEFLDGTRVRGGANRQLCVLLFTDLVRSTEHLSRVGNRNWQWLMESHQATVRNALTRYGGREIDTAGDGFFVSFALPSAAIQCAREIVTEARSTGLEVRAGLHAGEVEVRGQKPVGIPVVVAARTAAVAGPGEVLVTDTVRALTEGGGSVFEPVGIHELKGVEGQWRMYRLRSC